MGRWQEQCDAPRSDDQCGFALVVVIWILTLLSLIATSFTASMRTETAVSANMIDDLRARAHLEAGVHLGIGILSGAGLPEGWDLDGRPVEVEFDDVRLSLALQSESGKFDLNSGSDEILLRLLKAAGAAEELSAMLLDRIHDWRDEDDLHRLNGAEVDDYVQAGLNYGPANADFRSVDELRFVLGMPPDVFLRLRAAMTVFTGLVEPEPKYAPPLVLLALADGDQAAVQALLQAREAATPSGVVVESPVVTVRSSILKEGHTAETIEAAVWLTREAGRAYRIVDWRVLRPVPEAEE